MGWGSNVSVNKESDDWTSSKKDEKTDDKVRLQTVVARLLNFLIAL